MQEAQAAAVKAHGKTVKPCKQKEWPPLHTCLQVHSLLVTSHELPSDAHKFKHLDWCQQPPALPIHHAVPYLIIFCHLCLQL
jgi:hypothetical protein